MTARRPRHPREHDALLLDRRTLLRGAAAGLLATGTAGWAAACAGGGGPAADSATPATTGLGSPRPAVPGTTPDPALPYWLRGNFAPVGAEVEAVDLPVDGTLPPELSGLYVRNGSNPVSGTSPHWFLGDGMVHGVRLERGRARWYRNRYVATPLVATGKGLLGGGGVPGHANNQSNVSVFTHGGRLLSSGEVGWPYELDPTTLATVGPYDYGGRLTTAMTAHPKVDPSTGDLHFFGYGFVPPYLTYHVAAADGSLVHSEPVEVKGPTMVHDFAITERDVVFWDLPVVFDMQAAIAAVTGDGTGFPFRWDPSYGARLGVMPLGGPAAAIRWAEIEPCMVFHGVNAHRDGDAVVVDVCRLPSAFSDAGDLGRSTTHRWRIDTASATPTVAQEVLADVEQDLPTIDRRFTGRPHRHAWYAAVGHDETGAVDFVGVHHLDHRTGQLTGWDPGPGERVAETVFVPATGDAGEGEGWMLGYTYDLATDRSDLVVLDALDVARGPVARVHLPVRVPYGFHGTFVAD